MVYTRRQQRAAVQIQRAWRGYLGRKRARKVRAARGKQRFSRSQIGDKVGSVGTKEYLTGSITGDLGQRELAYLSLTTLPATATNDVNERQRNIVNCRGWKIYMRFNRIDPGTTNENDQPLYLNIAVVSPRHSQLGGNLSDNFWRDGTQNSRALNFNPGAGYWDPLVYNMYSINSDMFVILKHKKYKLGRTTTDASAADANKESCVNLKWWVPLKRQLRYEGAAVTANDDVYLVYWYDMQGTTATNTVSLTRTIYAHLVFREPKN